MKIFQVHPNHYKDILDVISKELIIRQLNDSGKRNIDQIDNVIKINNEYYRIFDERNKKYVKSSGPYTNYVINYKYDEGECLYDLMKTKIETFTIIQKENDDRTVWDKICQRIVATGSEILYAFYWDYKKAIYEKKQIIDYYSGMKEQMDWINEQIEDRLTYENDNSGIFLNNHDYKKKIPIEIIRTLTCVFEN